MRYKKKMSNLKTSDFLSLIFVFITAFLVLFILGKQFNVNELTLLLYFLFLFMLYELDSSFWAEFFWIIFVFTLNVLGVYACESTNLYLMEQQSYTQYKNALTPVIIAYVLFYGVIEIVRINQRKKVVISCRKAEQNPRLAVTMTILGSILVTILFACVIKEPYFVVGEMRIEYAYNSMGRLENSLKSYIPLFVPCAMICIKQAHKKIAWYFLIMTLLYHFWTGDKFGFYLFFVYIIMLCNITKVKRENLKKYVIVIGLCVLMLLGVVFAHRMLLYNDTIVEYFEYLYQRLCCQGGVWWKVYGIIGTSHRNIKEFSDELVALMPMSAISEYSVGQWKMLLVSADYSSYGYYRIERMNPYTATTTASLYYYFGFVGVYIFYIVTALLYGRIISYAKDTFTTERVLESMIVIKVISCFHGLLNSSDLYIISYKGIIYLSVLFILIILRKKNIHLKLGNFYFT